MHDDQSHALPDRPENWLGWTAAQQGTASDPEHFAWVSANAGSGKTHVLTQRVIRLLLSGARPSSILCLTYTKAAASEMSNRVFRTLANWALLDDETLAREIEKVEGSTPPRAKLAEGRRLFARALETPGGLKIQTIHAFCEALLHQFPLEANVAGHFTVLDDRGSAELLADVRRNLLVAATAEDDAELADAFETVMEYGSDSGLELLITDILAQRGPLREFELSCGKAGGVERSLRQFLNLPFDLTRQDIISEFDVLAGFEDGHALRYIELGRAHGGSMVQETIARLADALATKDRDLRARKLTEVFFKKHAEARANRSFFNATMFKQDPLLEDRIQAAIEQIGHLNEALRKFDLLEASHAALHIASRLNGDYEDLKKRLGFLDFEDLIEKTSTLLTKSQAGPWIHYKLDQGIDHILVDEAQDTSRIQWYIIEALSEDFFAGKSAREVRRTLFAVGDEKQSIYSFQGARPEQFAGQGKTVQRKALGSSLEFRHVRLPLSFRSTQGVLSAVDQVFSVPENCKGLSMSGDDIVHMSNRQGHPGSTQVWEMIAATESADEEDWTLPFDATPEGAPPAILARRIADTIADWLNNEETIVEDNKSRPIRPGDILVLVRKRGGFASALTRALKSRNNIPVGGADRLVLTQHIAVQDLLAIGRFVLLPEDDLSLAALSKSPLVNLGEDELMDAAANRGQGVSLWKRYQQLADEGLTRFGAVVSTLTSWMTMAEGYGPYEFFARILGPLGGRKAFLARLGAEAGDILDEFLNTALDHGQSGLPGLQSFISNLELEPPTIKREQDKDRDEVRIMTVHASKGLEAPIVFLVDDGSAPFNANHLPRLRLLGQHDSRAAVPLWVAGTQLVTDEIKTDAEERKALAEDEYRRLLYVGMTRAADRLIICGHRKKREAQGSWHQMAWAALSQDPVRCRETTFATASDSWQGLVWTSDEPVLKLETALQARDASEITALPDSLFEPLPPLPGLPRPLSPSGAGAVLEEGSAVVNTGSRLFGGSPAPQAAIARGRIIHRLFQVLPDIPLADRRASAERYLQRAAPQWDPLQRESAIEAVFRVLEEPTLAGLFSQHARAETNIMGLLTLSGREFAVSGRIDRMVVEEDRIVIADFKTDRAPPENIHDVPETYIKQLAIYRAILDPLYAGKFVDCRLIYTTSGAVFALPGTILDQALSRLGQLIPHEQRDKISGWRHGD